MRRVQLNGIAINHRRAGHGPDVVLIHGLAANHAFWHVNVLLPLIRDYRVTVYDLRGHGYSDQPPSGYTSADMAGDLLHLLDYLEIEKAHLIGHSVGGTVALHFAALHDERVASLTIADSRIRAFQATQRPSDWPNWATAKEKLAELGLNIPEDETDSGIWLLERLASPEWREARHKLAGSSLFIPFSRWGGGNRSAERWLSLLRSTTAKQDLANDNGLTREAIARIKRPALVIYGEKSPTVPSCRGLERCLPCCRSVLIQGAGHFFPLSKPGEFVRHTRAFLSECEQSLRHRMDE